MKCPKCYKPIDGAVKTGSLFACPHCQVKFMVPKVETSEFRSPEPTSSATAHAPVPRSVAGMAVAQGTRKGLMGAIIGLTVAVVVLSTVLSPAKSAANLELTPSQANQGGAPCFGKERCVLVYIAPWCGACKATIPAIIRLRDQWAESPLYGLSIIVGADTPERIEETASEVGTSTFVDKDASLHKSLKVNGVPYWLVLDKERKVIKSFAGGSPDPQALLYHLGFSN